MKSKGTAPIIDEAAAFYLYQYSQRVRMKDLGFTDSLENLDCVSAEAFTIIANEIDRVHDEEMKKKSKR